MKRIVRFVILAAASLYVTLPVALAGSNDRTTSTVSAAEPLGREASFQNPSKASEASKDAAPVNEKALKAYKKFQALPDTDMAAKTQAGEEFVKKFPSTTYTPFVYSFLTIANIQSGMMDKAQASAEKNLQLNPQDFRTMAVMSQAIARVTRDGMPDTAAQLAKSESYGKAAIAGAATATKPDGMTDENFAALKNQTLNMAHAGLGLVRLHRGDYSGAISELEQAVAIGPNDDPTNYYLLGVAYQNSLLPGKAVPYLEKCAAVAGNLQATCASNLEQSKKEAAQQASPK